MGKTGKKTAGSAERKNEADSGSVGRWMWEWTKSIAVAFLLFILVRTFVVEAFQIPTGSMEDTLLVGDFLFVNKFLYGAEIPFTGGNRLPGFRSPERRGRRAPRSCRRRSRQSSRPPRRGCPGPSA